MGLSSSTNKTTTVNTPPPQQTQAGNTLNSAFNDAFLRIQAMAAQIGGLIPNLIGQVQQGDAGINASRDWITRTLGGNDSNPYLDQMIAQSGRDTARHASAPMGTRGLTGGSSMARILAHEGARTRSALRYADYNNNQQMQAQAAGMAPRCGGFAGTDCLAVADGRLCGRRTARCSKAGMRSGMGGLFGNTGTQATTQTQSGGLLGNLLGLGLSTIALVLTFASRGRHSPRWSN